MQAALAVEAVEDGHGIARRSNGHTVSIYSSAVRSHHQHHQPDQSRHRDANSGSQSLRMPGSTGDEDDKYNTRRHDGSRLLYLSTRRTGRLSGAMLSGDEEMPRTRKVNGSQNRSEKTRHKADMERKLAESTGLRATESQSSKIDGQPHLRGPCEFDHATRNMKFMPTLPESNVLQEQEGVPARHPLSRQCSMGKPTSLASETACSTSSPEVTSITDTATATPDRFTDDQLAVASKGGPQCQCQCVKRLFDEAHVKMATTTSTPQNHEQPQSAASLKSPDQDTVRLRLHTGGNENVLLGDSCARVTDPVNDEERPGSMEEEGNTKASTKQVLAASSGERLTDKRAHQRSTLGLRRKEKSKDLQISDRSQFQPSVAMIQPREISWEHPCAANRIGGAAQHVYDDFEVSARPQVPSLHSRVHSSHIPSAEEASSFSMAGRRVQYVHDDLRTPAPCHGSSTPTSTSRYNLASKEKSEFKGARQQEVAVKLSTSVVAPQACDTADINSLPHAGAGVHRAGSLLTASGISHAGPEPNTSDTPTESALKCFERSKNTKMFEGDALTGRTEVVTAKNHELGCAIANESYAKTPPHPGAWTGQGAVENNHLIMNTGDVSSAKEDLQDCKHRSSPTESEKIRSQGLGENPLSRGIVEDDDDDGCHRRNNIDLLDKNRGNGCAVGRDHGGTTRGGGCDPLLSADLAKATVGATCTTVGAAGCTTVIFEELLDPKVVAVYSR